MRYPNQHLKTEMGLLLVVLMLGFSTTASADQGYTSGLADPCRIALEVAPEISWIKYTEPDLMEDEGYMYGINLSLIYHGPIFTKSNSANALGENPSELAEGMEKAGNGSDSWMLRADARASMGEVDYDGGITIMDDPPYSIPYKINDIEDSMLEFRGLVGYDFKNEVARATPYTGLGYRYLRDDTSFDPFGYERESNYLYVPLGVEVGFVSTSEWSLGTTIELDILVWGKQKSHLGDPFGTIENHQGHGTGFRASIRIQKTQPGLDFGIEPFVRLWSIRDSHVSNGFVEPHNRSVEAGLRLVWTF